MKQRTDDDDFVPRRRSHLIGPAAQARALTAATARLAARRQRDALPHRIETPRLVLRAPIRGDVPDIVTLADNRRIHEVLARLPHPYTRADGIAFVEIFAQRPDERPYAVTLDDRFIGVVGFTYHEGEPPELGYWLGEPHWGRGIMSEAVKALLEAAFATHLYPRIKARALASNSGSLNVLEKAGFVRLREDIETLGTGAGKPTVYLMLEQPKWT
ncbi:MAG: GNAT family N-acetyltransferase [Devosia sp.]|uniref:GNAT family N-acetyltransferase n=1 Tax=Devosia sp. TaxID=1871048 RepID=UPI001AC09FA8|nr:GNAT family N-acetyltransferase [Devosia sp.]MBN9317302.1 GNAT family N-acetyltransferase [Devosia sp.]